MADTSFECSNFHCKGECRICAPRCVHVIPDPVLRSGGFNPYWNKPFVERRRGQVFEVWGVNVVRYEDKRICYQPAEGVNPNGRPACKSHLMGDDDQYCTHCNMNKAWKGGYCRLCACMYCFDMYAVVLPKGEHTHSCSVCEEDHTQAPERRLEDVFCDWKPDICQDCLGTRVCLCWASRNKIYGCPLHAPEECPRRFRFFHYKKPLN